jgi:hypothetical protein
MGLQVDGHPVLHRNAQPLPHRKVGRRQRGGSASRDLLGNLLLDELSNKPSLVADPTSPAVCLEVHSDR